MAKVIITADTEAKTIGVTIDGETVDNVREAFCMGGEYYHTRITSVDDEKEDIVKVTTYLSKGSAEAARALKKNGGLKESKYNDFFEINKFDSVENDIADFLKK